MDSYREHPSDFDLPSTAEEVAREAAAPDGGGIGIGSDERRMHVRAYNYWVSLLDGRDYPSIEDLEPGEVQDFAPNSVLLDFTAGGDNPATPYVGAAIRDECGIGSDIRTISDVPSRSLLSRLTDHYLQIIANRAPVGFEAEFVNQRGEPICYRGILMPFSSDGDTIDFIYGVINWKQSAEPGAEVPMASLPAFEGDAGDCDGHVPAGEFDDGSEDPVAPATHLSWEDGPLAEPDSDEALEIELDESAGLADRLWAARETAEVVKAADGRSRAALYRALSLAYDFALASHAEPEDFAALLEDSGVKAQARAPMTPIVKLVFGIDYDKTRLTEFAAALAYAHRQQIELGGFLAFIDNQAGGLKALVGAERKARRPEPKQDSRVEAARKRLREAEPISLASVEQQAEFTLVLARRSCAGGVEAVAVVDDEAMVERAIRRTGV